MEISLHVKDESTSPPPHGSQEGSLQEDWRDSGAHGTGSKLSSTTSASNTAEPGIPHLHNVTKQSNLNNATDTQEVVVYQALPQPTAPHDSQMPTDLGFPAPSTMLGP